MEAIYESVLDLVLKKDPFTLMVHGKKKLEFRKGGDWIAARLNGRKYTHVKFRHAYAPDAPYFICEYCGFVISKKAFRQQYIGGFTVDVEPGDYIIILGKIVERGNLLQHAA